MRASAKNGGRTDLPVKRSCTASTDYTCETVSGLAEPTDGLSHF